MILTEPCSQAVTQAMLELATMNVTPNLRGWITRYTYETNMQNVSQNVNPIKGTVSNWQNLPLLCHLLAGGFDSTSTDEFAHT